MHDREGRIAGFATDSFLGCDTYTSALLPFKLYVFLS